MSFADYEDEQDRKKKLAEGWHYVHLPDGKSIVLVPPKPEIQKGIPRSVKGDSVNPLAQRTTDPDFYNDTLIHEITSLHDTLIDCFKELNGKLDRIIELLRTRKKRLKKK